LTDETAKEDVYRTRDEIDKITKKFKGGGGLDTSSDEDSEDDKAEDWFNHYM